MIIVKYIFTIHGLIKRYGRNEVLNGINLSFYHGAKIGIVGENGSGKSTLLKIIGGIVPIESGTCELGHNVEVGYFSQQRVEVLNLERTALEEAMERVENDMTEVNVRTLMGAFLFRGDDVFKRVKVLSGGEKSRLALIKLLLAPPNLLLLDEPTTHLDMPSIDAFIKI